MSLLNEFLFGYVSGMAAGATANVSIAALGFSLGVAASVMTGFCAFMGCLWLLWRGCCRIVTAIGIVIESARALGDDD